MLINNCDIVLVKHFFPATEAGLYAAVALVGRVIFAFSSAVVNSMFPIVAGTREKERKGHGVLATSLLLVAAIGSVLALALRLTPAWIWTTFFGSQFSIAGKYGLPYLLGLYAITTVIYSLSVVIIAYEMAYKISNTWVQLAFSGVVVAGICRFHSSLQQVIWIQLVLMLILLAVVTAPYLLYWLKGAAQLQAAAGSRRPHPAPGFRRRSHCRVFAQRLQQPGVRALPGKFARTGDPSPLRPCRRKRQAPRPVLHSPSFAVARAAAGHAVVRGGSRAGKSRSDSVFPRALWRKFARGNFAFPVVAERLHSFRGRNIAEKTFVAKLASMREQLRQNRMAMPAPCCSSA